MPVHHSGGSGRVLLGAIVVLGGLWLLLDNLDVIDLGAPWRWLPLVLVALGVWALLRSGFRQVLGPLILILIGVAVQLVALEQVPDQVKVSIWPAVIILAGAVLVFRGAGHRVSRPAAAGSRDLSITSAFSAANERVDGEFRRGQATCVFGSAEIDLRDAQISHPPAVVDISCIFGGAELRVPRGWVIRNDVIGLFGGVSDERRGDAEAGGSPRLSVQGAVVFGGLTLKD